MLTPITSSGLEPEPIPHHRPAYVGSDGVINIDREVEMAGPIHNKGVLILAGYLNGKYGADKPASRSSRTWRSPGR
mgnify:CR=1 FL=1